MLAKVLRQFAKLYGEVDDTLKPVPLLARALKVYQAIEIFEPDSCLRERAATYMALASLERSNNRLELSSEHYVAALELYRRQGAASASELSQCLNGLANLHSDINNLSDAEREYIEALAIRRHLAAENPAKFESAVASTLNNLAIFHKSVNRLAEAEREYNETLGIWRRLAAENPAKFEPAQANSNMRSISEKPLPKRIPQSFPPTWRKRRLH